MKTSSVYRVLEAAALVHREMHTGSHSYEYAISKVAEQMVLTKAEWTELTAKFEGETKDKIAKESKAIHMDLVYLRAIVVALFASFFAVML